MKKLLLAIAVFALLLMFQFTKAAEETEIGLQRVNVHLLQEDGDRVKYNNRLFSGIAVFKDGDGSLVSETEYSNGTPYGICHVYYKTGQIYSETAFEAGVATRITTYYPNSKRKSDFTLSDGTVDGYSSTFFPSGKPKGYTEYTAGKKNGMSIKYSESGDIVDFQIWENDTIVKGGDKK